MERIESFAPVVSQRAKVLILGTMPSVQSLREQFYYAHPRNAFWPILSAIYGMQATDIATKRQLIERCGLALWDVAGEPLAHLHVSSHSNTQTAAEFVRGAVVLSQEPVIAPPLIYASIEQ